MLPEANWVIMGQQAGKWCWVIRFFFVGNKSRMSFPTLPAKDRVTWTKPRAGNLRFFENYPWHRTTGINQEPRWWIRHDNNILGVDSTNGYYSCPASAHKHMDKSLGLKPVFVANHCILMDPRILWIYPWYKPSLGNVKETSWISRTLELNEGVQCSWTVESLSQPVTGEQFWLSSAWGLPKKLKL